MNACEGHELDVKLELFVRLVLHTICGFAVEQIQATNAIDAKQNRRNNAMHHTRP